ncbi:Protein kinase domain-containing protein [Aphelenchoides fujianensis]|nr:Protein kinase domain-containing protein [Aphelenchoides fujianensis]
MLQPEQSGVLSSESWSKIKALQKKLQQQQTSRSRTRVNTTDTNDGGDVRSADPQPINSASTSTQQPPQPQQSTVEEMTRKERAPALVANPPSPPHKPPMDFEFRKKTPLAPLQAVAPKKRRASIIIEKQPKAAQVDDLRLKSGAKVMVNQRTYVVDSFIGSGGSCCVYKAAVDGDRENAVALKIVDVTKADREMVKIFKNEIKFLRMLQDDAHVIKMYDSQVTENSIYVVMELGETNFKDFIKNRTAQRRHDAETICFYWREMVKCVSVIHSKNIVHADLKPANFVLVGGSIKLIDFGIAAQIAADEQAVCRKHVQGTLNYISPEAVECRPGGKGFEIPLKSDVWSLGCILYALHFGHAPFAVPKRSQEKQIVAICSEKIRYPAEPPMSPALKDVLKRCLTRDLNERLSVAEILKHPYITKKPLITDDYVRVILDAVNQGATPRTQTKKLKSILETQ